MITYNRNLLAGKTFHKFTINSVRWTINRNYQILGKSVSVAIPATDQFLNCINRAKDFCASLDPESWSMSSGVRDNYTTFLIEKDDDAALFRLGFAIHEKDYKGRVTFS